MLIALIVAAAKSANLNPAQQNTCPPCSITIKVRFLLSEFYLKNSLTIRSLYPKGQEGGLMLNNVYTYARIGHRLAERIP